MDLKRLLQIHQCVVDCSLLIGSQMDQLEKLELHTRDRPFVFRLPQVTGYDHSFEQIAAHQQLKFGVQLVFGNPPSSGVVVFLLLSSVPEVDGFVFCVEKGDPLFVLL